MKKRLILFLVLALLLGNWATPLTWAEEAAVSPAQAGPAADPVETEPAETEPVGTEPAETEPAVTEPIETEPAVTEPEAPKPEPLPDEAHTAYIFGDDSGCFRPLSGLTRAELAQILFNSASYPPAEADCFSDVPADAWYSPAVNAICAAGLVDGYPDGTYRPNRAVSRSELVTVLFRAWAGDADPDRDAAGFFDVPQDHWASSYILLARAMGWVDGYPDGSFRPDQSVTRAEAVVVLNRFWQRKPDRAAVDADPERRFFPDVASSDWFYYDVMEASMAHSFRRSSPEDEEQWTSVSHEHEELLDGFRCAQGRLYLVLNGAFVRDQQEGTAFGVDYICRGQSGVCTANADKLLLYNRTLTLLTQAGEPLYQPGEYPTGFYYHAGKIYAAKSGLLVQRAGRDTISGCGFTCEGESGVCRVEGNVLATVDGPMYRLVNGVIDFTPGLYSYCSGQYYVKDDGTLLQNGLYMGLRFGSDGRYTSGNTRIDAEIDRILQLRTTDQMTQEQKLFACYQYVFDTALRYRSNNNHVPRGQDCSLWAETYMLRLLDQDGYGNCYCFASEYYYLCRRIGYWQARAVSGGVFYPKYDHGWVEINIGGTTYLFDPRTDARYNKTAGALYMKTYDNAPYDYFPPN